MSFMRKIRPPYERSRTKVLSILSLKPETSAVGVMLGSWLNSQSSGRTIRVFLFLFVFLWTGFQITSYASVGLHPDLLEVYAWGLHPSAGYYKHPPLGGLMAGAWFLVFPAADWSFHLLAMTNAAAGLYATYLIACRYLKGDKRILAVLLLIFTPFYQFHGQRFASNQTLLSTWPIATYCFLRAFETYNVQFRGLLWGALAGLAAALAMLGKYYSIFLIAGFFAAVYIHPERWGYLRSWSPWFSALVGGVTLAPHIKWLVATGFGPFTYATAIHSSSSLTEVLWKDADYIVGSVAYVGVLLAVYWFVARPNWENLGEIIWPAEADGKMLVILLVVPLVLPSVVAPFMDALLTPLWTMQAWFLLPIVLLRPDGIEVGRTAAIGVAATVAGITLASLLAAPLLAWRYHTDGTKEGREYYKLVSDEVTRSWHAATGEPLKIVMGDFFLVAATTFYSADHPDSVPNFVPITAPWVTPNRLDREGWAAICAAKDQNCIDGARRAAANKKGVSFSEYRPVSRFLGTEGKLGQFIFVFVPPQ